VRWLYTRLNLFSSSPVGHAYVATLREPKKHTADELDGPRPVEVTHTAPVGDILGGMPDEGGRGAVWPAGDRLWSVHGDLIEVARYVKAKGEKPRVERLDPVRISEARVPDGELPNLFANPHYRRFRFDEGQGGPPRQTSQEPTGPVRREPLRDLSIIGADSAPFGFVLEAETGLLVIESSLESFWLSGEPVNWRVFPRSRHYTNQLQVVRENALEIFSFCGDYFVDQAGKRAGMPVDKRLVARFEGGWKPYERHLEV
jgi:hypothetical protein